MDIVYKAAADKLQEELELLLRQVEKKKIAINALYESMGEPIPYQETTEESQACRTIRADQFYGRPFSQVVKEWLVMQGGARTPEEITRGLEQGGYDFSDWSEASRVRNVAITMGKNSSYFERLPNGTYGLAEWYPNSKKKKERSKAAELIDKIEDQTNAGKEEEGEVNDEQEN